MPFIQYTLYAKHTHLAKRKKKSVLPGFSRCETEATGGSLCSPALPQLGRGQRRQQSPRLCASRPPRQPCRLCPVESPRSGSEAPSHMSSLKPVTSRRMTSTSHYHPPEPPGAPGDREVNQPRTESAYKAVSHTIFISWLLIMVPL